RLTTDGGARVVASAQTVSAEDGQRLVLIELRRVEETAPLRHFRLTCAEASVLAALARGASNAEIAKARNVSLATVRSQVSSILDKLGVRTRVEAAIAAIRHRVGD